MLYRIIKASFTRGRKRKTIAIAGITLGTAIATALGSVALDVGDKINKELRSYGANLLLLPKEDALPLEIGGVDYRSILEGGYLDETNLPAIKEIFWRHNIIGFVPLLQVNARLNGESEYPLVGTWFDKPMPLSDDPGFSTGMKTVRPYWHITGSWVDDETDERVSVVGSVIAQKENLKVGDRYEIEYRGQSRSLGVAGLVTTGGIEDNQIFVQLRLAQQLAGLDGKIKNIQVSALTNPENEFTKRDPTLMTREEYDRWYCTPYVSSIAFQLENAIPNSDAKVIRQVAESEGAILNKVKLMMLLIALAVLTASILGVMSTMTTTVFERRHEIGLLRALGAETAGVTTLFIVEAILMGLIGGVFGYSLGVIMAQIISNTVFGSAVSHNFAVVPVALAIAVGIALLGSTIPVNRAIRFDPAVILRGD